MSEAWDGLERRSAQQNLLMEKLQLLTDELKRTNGRLEDIATAFPANDPLGHRQYHEQVIARMKERTEFWRKMRFELSRWGLIGFIGWIVIALWRAFLMGPKP